MTSLRKSDCKELVIHYQKRFQQKVKRAYWVEDDTSKGPVYALEDEDEVVVAYGWFGANGAPCFARKED